ncbi:hypothetical protein [Aquimarina sp. AU474]|uniref:hypothetical protein n=1 Tax=Aquimarina sp. AU474 TaxID=2108529 RepID=UPI000D6A039F|nr:hypothetical protein [Aquimarina sp. AU474]
MKNKLKIKVEDLTFDQKVEFQKLKNDRFKSIVEIIKWGLISIGAIVSFLIIDIGNLNIEKFRADSSHEESLLNSYLESTKTANPDLWRRKLRFISKFSSDTIITDWAIKEEGYVKNKAGLLALYKETVGICSIVANRSLYGTEEWKKASKRYYQLYWAELPFYGETQPVIEAMINFKSHLEQITNTTEVEKWQKMDLALIKLSDILKKESKILEEN